GRPVHRRGQRLGHVPARAVVEAGAAVVQAARLGPDRYGEQLGEQAGARTAVPAAAEDLDVGRRAGRGLQLEVDGLPVVDALRGRVAVDARCGADVPVR